MADYTSEAVVHGGIVPTSRTAAAGDKLTDPGDTRILRVINGAGAPITLTITPPGTTSYAVANPDKVWTITNATAKSIPIYAAYGNAADGGKVSLTWSSTTTITFEYIRT